ncbi:MAG: hypothetical protein BGO05_28275 [Rhizobiales bacterium 63-7]|uniref:hypothetical protein n=1 Tax=Rhizobium TaxID=379 RepID=UPI0009282FE5|nr:MULTISPECIES: hypothetical protein [Rhizobium]MBN9030401.1 hypothetical protein [Hyphomicrobiales bacterium]MDG3578386.1 hypothetical protein [Rhizobium sp. YJ-22]OJU68630.1 MAG: hypothetical protein BGO05_28275 [Rhizobiales bacterium 63-7]
MTPNPVPAAGEAMPKIRATDEQVADAMRTLDSSIHALVHMTDITAEAYDRLFAPVRDIASDATDYKVFRLTAHEFEQFGFLLNDVANRCARLREAYSAAYYGEQIQ